MLVLAIIIQTSLRQVFAFMFGLILMSLPCAQIAQSRETLRNFINQSVRVTGRVADFPVLKKNMWRLTLEDITIEQGNNRYLAHRSCIYVMLPEYITGITKSDQLVLDAKLSEGFGDYDSMLYWPHVRETNKPDPPDYATLVRTKFSDTLRAQIPDLDISGLALGYLVGEKGTMSDEFSEALKNVGMAHAVVASGFHLGVIIGFAKKYLLKLSRLATLWGSIIAMAIFISIAGFSPSLARAGIVLILTLVAWYFGRRFHPLRVLLFAATISLFINPNYIGMIAWQLSFAAYSGIVLISPILCSYFYGDKRPGFLASSIIASVSAQLLCLPLMVFYFGKIPILGIFVNLVISPTIAIAMLLSVITVALSRISVLGALFSSVLSLLLRLHIYVVSLVNGWPWACISLEPQQYWAFIIYPVILIAILAIKRRVGFHYLPRHQFAKRQKYGKIYTC